MGCQMNEYDSDCLRQFLLDAGYVPATGYLDADLILINTCAVRAKAEQKAFSLLGRLLPLKKRNPGLILGMVGCIAQKEGARLLRRFPELDLVLGAREISRFQDILEQLAGSGRRIAATDLTIRTCPASCREGYFRGRVKGYISIMQGCNNFCSYCIVPYVRGREISRPSESILQEAENLVSQGVGEICLLGQNVNSYRPAEADPCVGFPDLLRRLRPIAGLLRLRFTTSHPKDLSEDLVRCFGEIPNLCPHIHLPVQAGSDAVLKRMNRRYTSGHYRELVERLRDVRPEIAVTSDMIVGFPGETEGDFERTLDLMRKIRFDNLFSFMYSDRQGTAAEKLSGKIDEKTKRERLQVLQALQKRITLEKNRELEGRKIEVLVEGPSRKGGQLTGRSGTNKVVNFKCDTRCIGELINVEIEHAFVNSLSGRLVEEP